MFPILPVTGTTPFLILCDYDKCDDFDILNVLSLDGDVSRSASDGDYIIF